MPASPLEVWDALAYALLMQGDYRGCLDTLEPRRNDPGRSFWLEHKLGDAYRGLNCLEDAVCCYRSSLADGSDSPLTVRNLLQVLDGLDPQRAVEELQRWGVEQVPSAGAWEGARQAAVQVPGLALADCLWMLGEADAACRQRLLEEACYQLDLARVMEILGAAQAQGVGLSCWEAALEARFQQLDFVVATSDRGVGAPRR